MKIVNLEQTTKILKHLAGRKPSISAIVKKVEGKAIQFSTDGIVTVETQFDNNKNKLKEGDKVSIAIATGDIDLVERAPKEKSLMTKIKDAVTPATKPAQESSTRGCSSAKAFAKERM